MSTKDLYLAPGLVKDHANDMKISNEEAKKDLEARVFQLIATYETDASNLLYWSRRDRTALNAAFQNHLADRDTKMRMLRHLASCDEVLLPLKDVLKFTMTCESRARFLVKLANFLQKLESGDLDLFVDCLTTLKRWTNGKPETPKENDLYLIECFDESKGAIPEKISTDLHSAFMVDRFDKILKLATKISSGEKI